MNSLGDILIVHEYIETREPQGYRGRTYNGTQSKGVIYKKS